MHNKIKVFVFTFYILIICSVFFVLFYSMKVMDDDEKYTLFYADFLNDETSEIATEYNESVNGEKETINATKTIDFSENNFNNFYNMNNDFVGYLSISNTTINYPVVQSSDNDYYLKHSFDKSNNYYGWIFMDYRNNSSNFDKNTIIYGHSMKANHKILFGDLRTILNNSGNYDATFRTNNKTYVFKIFSVYSIPTESYYLTTKFTSNVSYRLFLDTIIGRSVRNYGVDVSTSDKIFTFSTCYMDNERLVVHAKLVN